MALFGLKLAGTRTDITNELKKEDEKAFYNFFGRKAEVTHIDNFSEEYKNKKESLSFLTEMSQAQTLLEVKIGDLITIIEEKKDAGEPIAEYVDKKIKVQEDYRKFLDENSEKTLKYCPYTKKEESLNDEDRAVSWGKRLRAKIDKDYKSLIGMIVTEESMKFIEQGIGNLKKAYEKGEVDDEINYQYMYYIILKAKRDADEGLQE